MAVVYIMCKCRWSLKHGPLLLGAMAGISGAAFTTHFRHRMMLFHRARFAAYVPSIVIPIVGTTLAQQSLAYEGLLNGSQCRLCSDISVASVQVRTSRVRLY